ncbi:unnamed protein product [Psylliodes chrysocephalus]|uniref:HAT C-terminal dimerisation domain-containing protein n=1 Tax=Psylliodes chrysocephalus TaxID=3402493 RepID=A0A9P0GLB4_9CUCU|nr:unnamed protein product [Psylliodes chrysocephala]
MPDPEDDKRGFCKVRKCSLIAYKEDLLLHRKSRKHLESEKKYNAGPTKKIIQFLTTNILKKRKVAELKVAAFIAEHCSTRTAVHLSELLNSLDDNSELLKGVKFHRTKCTALILNVISPCLLEDLILDVGNENYSLIIDESTAIDCTKMMSTSFKSLINEDVDATVSEWNALHRVEWEHPETAESFWVEVSENKNALDANRFERISKLALALLPLPFSNATVKRAFSLANLIKEKLRNRLAISSAESIIRLRFHLMNNGCINFVPSENMLNKFNANMYNTNNREENEAILNIFAEINN